MKLGFDFKLVLTRYLYHVKYFEMVSYCYVHENMYTYSHTLNFA